MAEPVAKEKDEDERKDEKKVKEKDEDKTKDEKKVKEKDDGVINAVYKVNLHCKQCARDIKKPLMATQGVHNVEADMEKGEIKVKGIFDPTKIQKRLEKLSKKKVELISPKPQIKESTETEKKVVKETKEPISRTIVVKVHMHCDKCEQDLKKKLIKNKGIHNVKTDMKAQTLTVEGTIEPEKLISYLRKKVHKHAELVPSKPQKKEETKEKEKSSPKPPEKEEKKEKKEDKQEKKEETKEKEKSSPKPPEKEDKQEKKEDKKDGTEKSTESVTKVIEVKEQVNVVEVKTKESNTPYFIHYVYAPQTFSDENPNACFIILRKFIAALPSLEVHATARFALGTADIVTWVEEEANRPILDIRVYSEIHWFDFLSLLFDQ
ncbi:hypothetical protein ACFX16_028182 [Malus domestica]